MPDIRTDPLTVQRHFRLKVSVGVSIAVLSLMAALVLWWTRQLNIHHDHQPLHVLFLIGLAMWLLMSVAMMLPTTWNMVTTYLDIGFAARAKNMTVPPVAALIAGYLTVWSVFSVFASILQVQLSTLDLLPHDGSWPPLAFVGAAFLLAGLFELTSLKNHCLTHCRSPFSTILSRFRPNWLQVYRIGVEQGVYCLGCCWALMLMMFAAGLMNFGWMALLAAIMAIQKHGLLPRFDRYLAAGLIITGLALIGFGSA